MKLPTIEFAMNSAKSDTTGFAPFYLNTGRNPNTMIWNSDVENYKGVRAFARNILDAQRQAHDAILTSRVKQTTLANRKRQNAPFKENDLVYLSTQNISLPKGKSRKLSPKFIGPYKILRELVPGKTYKLELPADLKRRGLHDNFHASLLRIHVPNDDRRFPGRDICQLPGFGDAPNEWSVDRIVAHVGAGTSALFYVIWKAGDSSWMPYRDIKHLQQLKQYFEAIGCNTITSLRAPDNAIDESLITTTTLTNDAKERVEIV
jgi:hypothetical protein